MSRCCTLKRRNIYTRSPKQLFLPKIMCRRAHVGLRQCDTLFRRKLVFFSNFSFTPFFILVYSLTSANLLRAWNDVRFIIVTKWCNDSLVGYSKILHAKEVVQNYRDMASQLVNLLFESISLISFSLLFFNNSFRPFLLTILSLLYTYNNTK